MRVYAVIDTNVLVSALISRKDHTATVKILHEVLGGRIVPLLHPDIISEYEEVLKRPKFHLQPQTIARVLAAISQFGEWAEPTHFEGLLPDEDDRIFYEVTLGGSDLNSHLVTGNQKHYPAGPLVVTPAEMLEILEQEIGK